MLLLAPPPPPKVGPDLPLVRPLPRASAVGSWASCGIEAFARGVPGAVVVVEDEAVPLQVLPSLRSQLGGRFRLFGTGSPPQTGPVVPDWMDPTVIRSGGNVVHRVYSIGGVRN